MGLTPRLELRRSQSLVMTPQLQQAIKLLQLSNIELLDYVEQELERNPLLERDGEESKGENGETAPEDDPRVSTEQESASLESIDFSDDQNHQIPEDSTLDVDCDSQWSTDTPGDAVINDVEGGFADVAFANWGQGGGFDETAPNLEEVLSGKPSLRDHLYSQLAIDIDDPVDRMIGVHLIEALDEAGYIAGELAPIAIALGCAMDRVEAVLERFQQFDPPGIFARNLVECLSLQLRERNRLDPAMQIFLENLDLLAKRDLAGLSKICGVDSEDIADMAAEIRELDPKPALVFDQTITQPITPDVLMRPRPGGGWIIELNPDTLPRVLVNNTYHAHINNATRSKEDRQYINECYQSANWLVKSLHQRATTILKVSTEIVCQQDGFFANGVQSLKPLVLRDIAEVIEMHESTVSRVTSNKFIATPRGIFELKYFFTPAISSSSGGASHSAEAVRQRIKALIDAEPAEKILSDDGIVSILNKEGIDIARRTVAKYRESLSIPSSVQRRREKRHGF